MASTAIWTYHDVLDHLLQLKGGTGDARLKTLARMAIQSAYNELTSVKNWSYLYARGRVTTDAQYTTGTITYDHTGGTYERLLTLASGTWPTNAARGIVLISGVEYHADSRKSDTELTLSVNSNPGADVAAGTAYTWWRDTYPLPLDFQAADDLIDHSQSYMASFMAAGTVLNYRANRQQANNPIAYTFLADPDYVGQMAVMFEPPPDVAYNFDFTYRRRALPMRTSDYSTGTVATSGTTVTGTSTAWTSLMVGSCIRFGDTTNVPGSVVSETPFKEERIITAVASATSLTIDAALDNAYSGAKYRISDVVDLEQGAMWVAFLKGCEKELGRLLPAQDYERLDREYEKALVRAKEADSRHFGSRTDAPQAVNRLRFGRAGSDIGG